MITVSEISDAAQFGIQVSNDPYLYHAYLNEWKCAYLRVKQLPAVTRSDLTSNYLLNINRVFFFLKVALIRISIFRYLSLLKYMPFFNLYSKSAYLNELPSPYLRFFLIWLRLEDRNRKRFP